ncbi:MAG: succinylglutamate desuccinylase/aspartoacylase family protein [Alphaproteobacteria bacterium]|nr:succinylglutamate desuccinylase/aspartoacylase family protein [Alphaproteobacteria bacterium]MBU0798592.1 succinylglutamate desuccinylase/aspartoacylase family protein [Alphaproteobacteria bacterium]MBU0888147.1 succinylglutamate desuccinylase/aspartoacylase family protein [Alphaproteobacteria bacterium]MBU1811592.1 succinylglutamate desuccinylase/aspartoacylase family protein [Alphaproteobacteria bacterium]
MSDPVYTVDLTPPDIRPYRQGNTGIDYATTFDSGQPGPHVMVNAVTHGNELCGAIAVDFLFRQGIRPLHGKLTLSFANIDAYARFDRVNPTASRFVEEDFNRIWSEEVLDGPRDSVELRRARQMRPLFDSVDYLLDIHSMQHTTAPLMLCGPLDKGIALARALKHPEIVVSDKGHAAGKRLRDYRFFGDAGDPRNALLIECGQHWEKSSATVAIDNALRFLLHFGMIDMETLNRHVSTQTLPPQQIIQVTEAVTVKNDKFTFAEPYLGLEVIEKKGSLLGHDGDVPVHTPYDRCVLIMPSRRLTKGQTAVRLGRYLD